MSKCTHDLSFCLAYEDNLMLNRVCVLSGQARAAIGREAVRFWMMSYLLRRQDMKFAVERMEVEAMVAGSVDNQGIISG